MGAHNIKDGKRIVVTHGEVVLKPIDAMPRGKTKKVKSYIAGHSETGHNHVLESDVEMEVFESATRRAVLIKDVSKLFHDKTFDIHETRTIAPGAYDIIYKSEYNPFTKVIQRVYD